MPWLCLACSGSNPDGTRFCGQCGSPRAAQPAAPAEPQSEDSTTSMVADALRGLVARPAADAAPSEGPALRDERRLVTALFADISGFSELTNRLDPEQLLEVIDPAISTLSNVVGRYGGVIEKFAGDALMALFGAPVAHDDDAARALHVAMDMHRELAKLVPTLPPEAANLRLHVGVNSGHGIGRLIGSEVRFDYAVLGDVVVLAQRLEASAPTGETYVGETTHRLTRKDFDFEFLGEIAVKGKDKPVPAWRLVGPRERRSFAVRTDSAGAMVGRDDELQRITEFSERLEEGRGGAVFVVGEPGVGKTTLCDSLHAHAIASGWQWLTARCLSYGRELAYWPVADLLRRFFDITEASGDAALPALRSGLAAAGQEEALPVIGTLLGVEGTSANGMSPQETQRRLHESVIGILRARAAQSPVVLCVDDLHWVDGPTLTLLREMAETSARAPLLLLASARPEGGPAIDEMRGGLDGSALRLDLRPLAGDAVRQIAARVLGAPPAPPLAVALYEHTGGNPFFLEEVARSLLERGGLVQRDGELHTVARWDDAQVPVTVEGVLSARIDSLAARERGALEVASVIGRRVDMELARAVSGDIDTAMPTLTSAGLLDPVEGTDRVLLFHHPLTQQVVYARLLRRRRAELHRRVGQAAESLFGSDEGSVDLLARHFHLGEDAPRAYDYLLRAAARAERLFANEQAITCLDQAAEVVEAATGSAAQQPELWLRAARLEEVRGGYPRALELYDRVLDSTGDIRAAIGRAATLRKLGRYEHGLATVERARLDHAPLRPQDTGALALEEGWLRGLRGEVREAIDALRAGLAAVAGGDHNSLQGQVLIHLARIEELVGDHADAVGHAEEARRRFEAEEDLPRLATVLRVLGGIYQDADPDDREAILRSRQMLERALVLARRVGNAEEEAASLVNLGQTVAALGDLDEALRCDRESIAVFDRVGLKAGVACGYCNLAQHLLESGRPAEARQAAEAGLAVAEEIGHLGWMAGARIGIADASLALGDDEVAASAGEAAAEAKLAVGERHKARSAFDTAAQAHERLGHHERAAELRRRMAEIEA